MKRDVVTICEKKRKKQKCCKLINKQLNYELTEIDQELFKHLRKKIVEKF